MLSISRFTSAATGVRSFTRVLLIRRSIIPVSSSRSSRVEIPVFPASRMVSPGKEVITLRSSTFTLRIFNWLIRMQYRRGSRLLTDVLLMSRISSLFIFLRGIRSETPVPEILIDFREERRLMTVRSVISLFPEIFKVAELTI